MANSIVVARGPPPKINATAKLEQQSRKITTKAPGAVLRTIGHSISLDVATKELLGLVASMVLRCDDCVKYHLENCHKEQLSKNQVMEALEIATVVGGSIVIPHLRRAYEYWEALETETT